MSAAGVKRRLAAALGATRRRARPDPPVCDDLAAWVPGYPGAERIELEPGFAATRALPRTIEARVHDSFVPLCAYDVPPRALVTIPDARVRTWSPHPGGEDAVTALPDGRIVGEQVALTPEGRRRMLRQHADRIDLLPRPERRLPGPHVAVLGLGMRHYYHWGHDIITSLRGVADRLPAGTTLVAPADLRPFQIDMLGLTGLQDLPRREIPAGACWELERLLVVTPRLKTQIDTPEPLRWFREQAMRRYAVEVGRPTRRLYLSRRDDWHWRTVNEPEVETFLASLGFESVQPARLDFRGQIELFRDAELIVGTGAGLFNMAFAPPGAKVLQLQEPAHVVHALWTQAEAMGIEYHYVMCESVANAGPNADLRVPIDKLAAAVDALTA